MASPTSSSSTRLLSLLSLLLATLHTFVLAQQATVLDTSKLPKCASQCTPLVNANKNCVPPAAPVTNQGTYQSCYCQSTLLVTLYSTRTGLCDSACTPAELQQIQDWYKGLCTGGKVVTPAAGKATTTSKAQTGNTATATTTSGASQTSGATTPSSQKQQTGSWISNHWQWVVLLIVLFLAFIFFLVGGLWLKRYLRRRRAMQRFSGTGQLQDARSPSPFNSGILAPSDGAYLGSRNHPPMSAVAGAGSAAAMERYSGYVSNHSRDFDSVPSPPPATGGTSRSLPWMNNRMHSGGTGSKRSGNADTSPVSPVSPADGDAILATDDRRGRKSNRNSLKKKISKKSNSRSSRRTEDA